MTGNHPEKRCKKGGQSFAVGDTVVDDYNPCRICECCKSGKFKCKPKVCPNEQPPPCGASHYEAVDECCPECSVLCKNTTCPPLQCSGPMMYPFDSCCPVCACNFREHVVPVGPITEGPAAACEQCICNSDATVTCQNEAQCPAGGLQCVNPAVFDNGAFCEWYCPNGKTCYRGDELILPGEYKIVRDQVCFCHDWHPIALCANVAHWGRIEQMLYEDRCLRRPESPSDWNILFSTLVR